MNRNNKGFTLVELMVVIVIIGILAALAIPKFMDATIKAKIAEIPTVLGAYDHAELAHISETGAQAKSTDISFTAPTDSKWFTYGDGASAGIYEAAPAMDLGDIKKAAGCAARTTVDVDGTVHHVCVNALVKRYIPSFERN
jgi:prepilin-type N-terminal cleavage/methylation domain-containing protein